MTIPFWSNDPTIIFNKEHIFELWPSQNMIFESKLNAISRTILILTILGFIFTRNWNIIIIGILTLAIVFALYKLRKNQIVKEGFTTETNDSISTNKKKTKKLTKNPVTLESELRSNFHPTTKKNPFGNVLITDITDNPNRKSAAPSFNPDVYDEIDKAVKKQTQMLNPDIINTNKQLYGDLHSNYELDKSLMRFYSTANTRVENDQGAFSKYLYGSMYSAKEDTPEGALMRVKDNWQWINP